MRYVSGVSASPEQSEDSRHEAVAPLRKLVELALVHADIGPPLADLAFAIGQREIGEQLLRMGTDREHPQLEYFVVAAFAARRARRYPDTLRATLDGVRAYAAGSAEVYGAEDGERLLHLVRTGLGVLMFDLKDLSAEPEFTRELAALMAKLEDRLGQEPLYRTLFAQALWFSDREASEREWERARELADGDSVWNARGTWYKEAEKDLEKAERAYRTGLEKAPHSALLLHNLAQVLVERAEKGVGSPGAARQLLNQAQDLLRRSLQADVPRLRRHIHATRDRLEALRRSLPPSEPAPRTEDRRPPDHRDNRDNRGPRRDRAPERGDRGGPDRGGPDRNGPNRSGPDRSGPPRERREPPPGQQFLTKGTVSLADMIMAKLNKEKEKG